MIKNQLNLISAAFAILILASCSSGSGSGNNPGNDGSAPQTPGQAIQKLSDEQRQAFENWKAQLVKSCDGTEAFGLRNGDNIEQRGLDAALLLAKNNRSAVIAGHSGDFAILGGANSIAGTGNSKVEHTENINGMSYHLQAELQRQGSDCVVMLFGQKVYETYIAASFDVAAYWNPSPSKPKAVQARTTLKSNTTGVTIVSDHGLIDAVASSFQPTHDTTKLLASNFGIQEDDASRLFRLNSYSFGNAVRLADGNSGLWFNSDSPQLVGQTESLKKLFDGSKRTAQFEWRVAIPQLSYGGVKNDADSGNLKFIGSVEISSKQDNPQLFNYSATAITLVGKAPFDKAETSACVKDRVRTLKMVAANADPSKVQPDLSNALAPCRPLSADMDSQVYLDGTLKGLVPEVLAGVVPSSQTQYSGWDAVVSTIALDLIDKGLDVRTGLDPSGSVKVVQDVADNLATLKSGLQLTTNLTVNRQSVYQMGLAWSFTGQKVSGNRITRILKVVDNTISPFQNSTQTLLRELSRLPNGNEDTLTFAEGIGSDYKAEANRALGLATTLDYSEWQRDYFDQILQKKVSIDDLKNWSARLQGIQSQIVKYPNLKVSRGSLVRLAIKWTNSGEATLDQIGKVYASLNNAFDPFQESTNQLVQSLSDSLANNKSALDFAGSLSSDYKRVAISIRDTAAAVGLNDWGKGFFGSVLQKRPEMNQLNAWNATLQAGLQYTQREQSRMQGDSWGFNEGYRKDLIKTALNEGWVNDDFTELEQISAFGKYHPTCDQYKGVSSILNCVGMSQFSRGWKKFLDPAFNRRYGPLASEFVGYIGMMTPEFDYFSLRNSLINGFFGSFGPIWAFCSDSAYQAKSAALRSQIPARVQETDQFKKWDLERAISKTLEDCR